MLKARLASVLGHWVTVTGLPLLSAEPWPHVAQNWTHRGLNKQTPAKGGTGCPREVQSPWSALSLWAKQLLDEALPERDRGVTAEPSDFCVSLHPR